MMYTKIKRALAFMTGAVMLCSMSPVPIRFSEPITANAAESVFSAEQSVTNITAEASPDSGKIGDNLTWTVYENCNESFDHNYLFIIHIILLKYS